jgi:hypothetical protein
MDQHVNSILSIIYQRFYLLNQLKKNGFPTPAFICVFHSLIVSRILYALPDFSGFLSAAKHSPVGCRIEQGQEVGITDLHITMQDLIDETDEALFFKIHLDNHCIHHLLISVSPAS